MQSKHQRYCSQFIIRRTALARECSPPTFFSVGSVRPDFRKQCPLVRRRRCVRLTLEPSAAGRVGWPPCFSRTTFGHTEAFFTLKTSKTSSPDQAVHEASDMRPGLFRPFIASTLRALCRFRHQCWSAGITPKILIDSLAQSHVVNSSRSGRAREHKRTTVIHRHGEYWDNQSPEFGP